VSGHLDKIVAALDEHAAKTPTEKGERIEFECPTCHKRSWSYECYLAEGQTVADGVAFLASRHVCKASWVQ